MTPLELLARAADLSDADLVHLADLERRSRSAARDAYLDAGKAMGFATDGNVARWRAIHDRIALMFRNRSLGLADAVYASQALEQAALTAEPAIAAKLTPEQRSYLGRAWRALMKSRETP